MEFDMSTAGRKLLHFSCLTESDLDRIKATRSMCDFPRFCATPRSSTTIAQNPQARVRVTCRTVDSGYSLQAVPLDKQLGRLRYIRPIGNSNGRIICWNRGDVGLDWQEQKKEAERNCHGLEGEFDKHDGGWRTRRGPRP